MDASSSAPPAVTAETRELTATQRKVIDSICRHVDLRGYPPTVRELCGDVGLTSTSSIAGALRKLEEHGHIRRGIGGHAFPTATSLVEARSRR